MLRYLVRRLLFAAVTTFGVATIVFISMRLVPGGFAQALVGANAARNPEIVEAIEERFGLDEPVLVQYWYWLRNAVQGDFGDSLRMNTPVSDELVRRLKITLELTGLATLMSIVIGVPAGVFAALRRNSFGDVATRIVSTCQPGRISRKQSTATARKMLVAAIKRRRFVRSAITPATGPKIIAGSENAMMTRLMAVLAWRRSWISTMLRTRTSNAKLIMLLAVWEIA